MNKRIKEEKKQTTAIEQALVEAQAAKQARMDQQAQALEQRVDDGFEYVKKLGGDRFGAMSTAMGMIAGLFFDPYERTDHRTGVVTSENALGFWQDGVLGGILFQLHSKLDYSQRVTLPKAKAAAQQAIRSHKGDEISEEALSRAVAWVQRLTDQVTFAQSVIEEAEEAYTAATGKIFEYRSRLTANADVVETPAMKAAKALGIGVQNVAPGFGSAQAEKQGA